MSDICVYCFKGKVFEKPPIQHSVAIGKIAAWGHIEIYGCDACPRTFTHHYKILEISAVAAMLVCDNAEYRNRFTLNDVRRNLGFGDAAMARILRTTPATVQNWVRLGVPPRKEHWERLGEHLAQVVWRFSDSKKGLIIYPT